jgi:hypothetical protein
VKRTPRARSALGAIWSLKFPVTIDGKKMNLFDARDLGLVEINKDPLWDYYSYRVISTGEVVSFYRFMNPKDWSDWYREAIAKGPERLQSA